MRRYMHRAMASTFVIAMPDSQKYAERAATAAFESLDLLEFELSRFNQMSDVCRVSSAKRGESVMVGEDAFRCIELALRICSETSGAFDILVNPNAADGEPEPLAVESGGESVAVRCDDAAIDLGAIGKGYALDRMLEIVTGWEIERAFLFATDSTAVCVGAPDDSDAWRAGLSGPFAPGQTLGSVALRPRSGISYSETSPRNAHIRDPRCGALLAGTHGAWAIAPSAAEADALTTAFTVMVQGEVEQYCSEHLDVTGILPVQSDGATELIAFGNGVSAIAPSF